MRINFRQGIVSHQSGGFLQVSGNVVNILAVSRAVTLTLAHKNTNYTHSEDNSVASAWIGPFTEPNYWLYWDFNPLTFARSFGYTTVEPIAQSVEPGNGNVSIVAAIPGDPGIGGFVVNEYYNLAVGRTFSVVGSTANNGNYTVKNISYNISNGQTTIYVNEAVASSIADGETTLDVDSSGTPLYVEGRHWFDTSKNIQYVLQSNIWVPVLRLFAAQLINGNTLISLSQNSQFGDFTGTQIGNNNSAFSGRVLFDEATDPIRRDDGTFFTTEDQFFTNQSRVDALRLESNVTRGQCIATAISAFSVIAWKQDGQIDIAQYDDVENTVTGLLTENLTYLEVGAVIVQGSVTNPSWNWTQTLSVGAALWVENGVLVAVDPNINDPLTYPNARVPVARVLSNDTIIFEQGLGGVGPQGAQGLPGDLKVASTTDLGGVTLLTASSDTAKAFVISDTDSRLTNARAPLAHTHQATDISFQPAGGVTSNDVQSAIFELGTDKLNVAGGTMTGLLTLSGDPTAQAHATTKKYVDNLVNGLIWLEPIHGINLIDNSISIPPGSPNHGDAYIMPTGGGTVGDWISISAGHIAVWDDNASIWNDLGLLQNIDTGNIRLGIAFKTDTVPAGSFTGKKNQIAIFDTSGTLTGFEVPTNNNAVYVSSDSSLFAFDQYAFDGTGSSKWIRFGGSNQALAGDPSTIEVHAGIISVVPTSSGGAVDALTLSGNNLATLDLRWAAIGHTHPASTITFAPYAGDGLWGTPSDASTGGIASTFVSSALEELADSKAAKTPLYATLADLPSATTQKGMIATIDDVNTVYFADDSGWSALARGDHIHNIPYDMAFFIIGILTVSKNVGIFLITRTVFVGAGASNSIAVATVPATISSTNLIIRKDSPVYGSPLESPVDIGNIQFLPGDRTGTITWPLDVTFNAGDRLIIATDSAPTDVEEISVTIVGCTPAPNCIV